MSWEISKLPQKLQEIAKSLDQKAGDSDKRVGWIGGSVFQAKAEEACKKGTISLSDYNSVFSQPRNLNKPDNSYKAPCDKTRVHVQKDILPNTAPKVVKTSSSNSSHYRPFNSAITVNSPVKLDPSQKINVEILNKAFNKVIEIAKKEKGMKDASILKDTANKFLNSARMDNRGLSPFVLMGIAIHESSAGCSNAALNKRNVGGLREKVPGTKDKYRNITFNNVNDSINGIGKTVNKRYNEGYKTINKVAHSGRYCGKSEAVEWKAAVVRYAEMIRKEYNRLLAGQ